MKLQGHDCHHFATPDYVTSSCSHDKRGSSSSDSRSSSVAVVIYAVVVIVVVVAVVRVVVVSRNTLLEIEKTDGNTVKSQFIQAIKYQ